MDKWLRQHASNRQKPEKPQKSEQEIKEERDLQLALEESQFASDMEKAIALSLRDVNTHASAHHNERQISASEPSPSDTARRQDSSVSVTALATTRTGLINRGKKKKNTVSRKPTPSAPPPSDTWAVETFVNDLLNRSAAAATKTGDEVDSYHYEDSSELEGFSFASNTYDSDATTDDDTSQPQRILNSAITVDSEIDDDATVDEADEDETANAAMKHELDSDNDWEIVDDIDTAVSFGTTDHASTPKQDLEAGDQFFSQFRRETWDKDELRLSHDAMKRRSMASALKKNKKQRTYLSHGASTDEHNYYTTADDVLEEAFDAAGFGDSAAGLSWEGIGQSRYS